MNLAPYVKAQYSILYLVTPEESRAEAAINETAKELKRNLTVWSQTEGMFSPANPKHSTQIEDPIEALIHIKGAEGNTIYVMRDLSSFFSEPRVIRHLRDIARDFKQSKKTLIITSPIRKIPPELERDVTVIEFELPLYADIKAIFDVSMKGGRQKSARFPTTNGSASCRRPSASLPLKLKTLLRNRWWRTSTTRRPKKPRRSPRPSPSWC